MPNAFTTDAANEEHLHAFLRGVEYWNQWRNTYPYLLPVLANQNFSRMDLRGVDLSNAVLRRSNLSDANLTGANLYQAEMYGTDLRRASLVEADLRGAKLHNADLRDANLGATDLYRADFIGTRLDSAQLADARCQATAFSDVDLSNASGLEKVYHTGPSSLDVATLLRSAANVPRVFLTGAGLSDEFIDKVLTVAAVTRPVQMNSVFISYSSADEEFATRLHAKLRENDVRVWFAPKDMMPGRQIYEQIDEAIQLHDRLMLVLSRRSLASNWVTTELRKAIYREKRERRRVIFPIRLVPFSDLQTWECFDADLGSDLAAAVREYFVPDFSEWRSSAKLDVAVQQLLQALRDSSSKAG